MWLLDRDGLWLANIGEAAEVAAETAVEALPEAATLVLRFGANADGRGFSTARQARARGLVGRLIAAGPLVPDQARHAFQSGFDGILVDGEALARQGEAAWREALAHVPDALYVADGSSRAGERSIWAERHPQ